MEIKEIKITKEGYEVTLLWTKQDIMELQGFDIPYFLRRFQQPPQIDLQELIAKTLEKLKESSG